MEKKNLQPQQCQKNMYATTACKNISGEKMPIEIEANGKRRYVSNDTQCETCIRKKYCKNSGRILYCVGKKTALDVLRESGKRGKLFFPHDQVSEE